MAFALELRGVVKRFAAGFGSCLIRADVLRGADLAVRPGESVALVAGPGAGKSTLLLCAAGLLKPDAGDVRWFGDTALASAALRSTFYFAGAASSGDSRRPCPGDRHLHLIDGLEHLAPRQVAKLAAWSARRCADGDAVIVASRDASAATMVTPTIVAMRRGRLETIAATRTAVARVAER